MKEPKKGQVRVRKSDIAKLETKAEILTTQNEKNSGAEKSKSKERPA